MAPLVKRLLSMVATDSFSYQETSLANQLEAEFASLQLFERVRLGNSLIFTERARVERPLVALYGHLDTVPNQQSGPPFATDEAVFGCGASDMKAGLAVMAELMLAADASPKRPFALQFVFYDGEEGAYEKNGLSKAFPAYLHSFKPLLALVLEPTLNTIQTGCLGNIHATLTLLGKSGHSARPWEADNAILKAIPWLEKIRMAEPVSHLCQGLIFKETINATTFHAGTVGNVIPGEAVLNINYRFPPTKTEADAWAYVEAFFPPSKDLMLKKRDSAPSGKVVLNNILLNQLIEQHQLKISPKQAWTDIARLTSMGIDAVNFGPGDPAQCHQKDEFAPIKPMLSCFSILKNFLLA